MTDSDEYLKPRCACPRRLKGEGVISEGWDGCERMRKRHETKGRDRLCALDEAVAG